MQDRYERINQFLKFWRDILIENPNTYISKDDIYSQLVRMGINYSSDYTVDLQNEFDSWIDYYRDNPNIIVFNSDAWRYFCQFRSRDVEASHSEDHIKIYVPLDAKHIENGAKYLFDFISANNISHVSKIGRRIRFDDIVIRVVNSEDAKKILNFIKNNEYIQEGLIKPNPFAFNQDGIALACDGSLSFNSVISNLISIYMSERKKENRLNLVEIGDFYTFVADIYNKEFLKNEDNPFRSISYFTKDYKEHRENYREIFELILNCVKNNFTLDSYFEHFNQCIDNKNNEKVGIDNVILSKEEVDDILIQALEILAKNGYNACKQVQAYVDNNDEKMITRDENLRNYLISKNFRNNLIRELNGMSVSSYTERLLNNNSKTNNDENLKNNNYSNFNNLSLDIISVSAAKYGYDNAIRLLREYLNTGNDRKITRDKNLRNIVVNSNYRENVLRFIRENNMTIEQYVANIQRFFNETIMFDSLKTTYLKFENEKRSGKAQIYFALNLILNEGNYGAITSYNNARENLLVLSPEAIMGILISYANYPYKQNYSTQEIEYLVLNYVNHIQEKIYENGNGQNVL